MEDKVMFVIAIIIIIAMIIAAIFFEYTPIGKNIWAEYVSSREEKNKDHQEPNNKIEYGMCFYDEQSAVTTADCLL